MEFIRQLWIELVYVLIGIELWVGLLVGKLNHYSRSNMWLYQPPSLPLPPPSPSPPPQLYEEIDNNGAWCVASRAKRDEVPTKENLQLSECPAYLTTPHQIYHYKEEAAKNVAISYAIYVDNGCEVKT